MATISVPALSATGWTRSPAEKADYLMSHFYESDKFQTYLYGLNVCSLPWLIEQYGNEPARVCREIEDQLGAYLSRYYDSAVVQCVANDNPDVNPTSEITLRLYCQVTEEGKEYVIARLIMTKDSKFQKIVKLNNQGNTL
jgi:hypothetical protein